MACADCVLAITGDATNIIPGHRPLSRKAELKTWRHIVAPAAQRNRDTRKAGKSDFEIRAAKPAADYEATDGRGFIKP